MVVEKIHDKKSSRIFKPISKQKRDPVQLYNHVSNGFQIPDISIIMPAFNEEIAVGLLIDRTIKVLQKITSNFEIIVVDDGSKDQTLDIIREKNVMIIHNHLNYGKGYALREGFKHARGNIIITIDSDGDHNPKQIPLIIRPILNGSVDVVVGTRFIKNNKRLVTSAFNTFGNKLFNFLIRYLTNYRFTDTQCGFRAFRREILENISFNSKGYSIETEMLIALTKKQIRIQEIPIYSPVKYNRKSNLNRFRDGLKIFYTIIKSCLK